MKFDDAWWLDDDDAYDAYDAFDAWWCLMTFTHAFDHQESCMLQHQIFNFLENPNPNENKYLKLSEVQIEINWDNLKLQLKNKYFPNTFIKNAQKFTVNYP